MSTDQRARAEMNELELRARKIANELVVLGGAARESYILTALADERRRALEEAANLYESIKPSCDHEPGCGAGAMGAVLQFRDLIRAKAHAGQEGCRHEWGTDGAHSNEFCKRCFQNKPQETSHD